MIDGDAFGPGPLTRREMRELQQMARQLNRPAYLCPPLVGQSDSVADRAFLDTSILNKLGATLAKVTSGPTVGPLGEKRYAWTEQVVPQGVTTTDKVGGLSGTTTSGWLVFIDPATGAQYSGTVPSGARVPIWKSTEGDWWWTLSSFLGSAESGAGAGNDWFSYHHVGTYYYPYGVPIQAKHGVSLSTSVNTMYAVPLLCPRGGTVERLALYVYLEASTGGSTVRMGIYESTSQINLYPGALLLDAGTVDVTTTGFKTLTVSQTLEKNKFYWLTVFTGDAAGNQPQLTFGYNPNSDVVDWGPLGAAQADQLTMTGSEFGWRKTSAGAYGALPATFPASGDAQASTGLPLVFVRYSA